MGAIGRGQSRHQDADEVGGLSFGLRPAAILNDCCGASGSDAASAFRPSDIAAQDSPSARIFMSSDLPLEISLANSSAVKGKSFPWECLTGFPKKCLNQSASRPIVKSRAQSTKRGRCGKFPTSARNLQRGLYLALQRWRIVPAVARPA
jgi:hypothetical protein